MTGLKRARIVWTVVFLGVTLAAIVMECVAGLWHPTGWTIPWTEYLARYVPWPIQLLAYVALAVWLPFHFWRHDHMRKVAYKQGYRAAQQEAFALRMRLESGAPIPPTIARPGDAMCSHGYVFGRTRHHCGELPSDATRFVPGRSNGR